MYGRKTFIVRSFMTRFSSFASFVKFYDSHDVLNFMKNDFFVLSYVLSLFDLWRSSRGRRPLFTLS